MKVAPHLRTLVPCVAALVGCVACSQISSRPPPGQQEAPPATAKANDQQPSGSSGHEQTPFSSPEWEEISLPDPWLGDDEPLWVRTDIGCTQLPPTGSPLRVSEIEVCRREHGSAVVSCREDITIDRGVLSRGTLRCEQEHPDGSLSRDTGSLVFGVPWSAVSIEDGVVEMGDSYRLRFEPSHSVLETAECQPGSAQQARARLEAEGEADLEASMEQMGVFGSQKRCRRDEGIALTATLAAEEAGTDRGMKAVPVDELADCSKACEEPPILEEIRRRNEGVAGRRFVRKGVEATGRLYLTAAKCEAAAHPPSITAECDPI